MRSDVDEHTFELSIPQGSTIFIILGHNYLHTKFTNTPHLFFYIQSQSNRHSVSINPYGCNAELKLTALSTTPGQRSSLNRHIIVQDLVLVFP